MRILYFVEQFWPAVGGLEVHAAAVLPRLVRRGHAVTVATFGDDVERPDRQTFEGLEIRNLGDRRSLHTKDVEEVARIRQRFLALKREVDPEILHVNASGPGLFVHVMTKHIGTAPTIVSFHGTDFLLDNAMIRGALEGATWATGCSEAVTEEIRALDPELAGRSSSIVYGLEPPSGEPGPVPFNPPVLVCAARLSPEKGIDVAIDAFARLRDRAPTARLVIAGDGLVREDLAARAVRLGIGEAVEFLGWVAPHAVPALIERATVVVVPSRSEGFGLIALEAMLAGRPVVGTDVGGLGSVVGDGGIVVSPDDPPALAEAILRILRDPDLAATLARNGRARGIERFSLDRCVEDYERLYLSLVTRS